MTISYALLQYEHQTMEPRMKVRCHHLLRYDCIKRYKYMKYKGNRRQLDLDAHRHNNVMNIFDYGVRISRPLHEALVIPHM